MLKGRGKAFAPKKSGMRRAAAPIVSTPPQASIPATQTQTPEESADATDQPSATNDSIEPSERSDDQITESLINPSPLVVQNEPATSSANEISLLPSPTSSKRKERDYEDSESPAKRSSILITSTSRIEERQLPTPLTSSAPTRERSPSSNNEAVASQDLPTSSIETPCHPLPTELLPAGALSAQSSNITSGVGKAQDVSSANEVTPQSPRRRYPSPENMVRVADDFPVAVNGDRGSMGPAGGRPSGGLGRAGDLVPGAGLGQIGSGLVPAATLNPDGTSGVFIARGPVATSHDKSKKRKAVRKPRTVIQAAENGDDVRANLEMQLNRPRRIAGVKKSRKKKDNEKPRRQRAETPENAEEQEIVPDQVTMEDLCKDPKIGQSFSRAKELREREIETKMARNKRKLAKNNPEFVSLLEGDEEVGYAGETETGPSDALRQRAGESESNAQAPKPAAEPQTAVTRAGVQMKIVNGQIVVDESTLQLDRHKMAEAANIKSHVELLEDEFTSIVTSGTLLKRSKSGAWDDAATELFYDGLSQFGTDFEMIAKMFPHRDRRSIKLKFNSEEKKNGWKITKAMKAKKKDIDLEHFAKMSNIELESVAAVNKEIDQYNAAKLAEELAREAFIAEENRKKKEQIQAQARSVRDRAGNILAEVGSDEDDEATLPGRFKKGKARAKKALAAGGVGG